MKRLLRLLPPDFALCLADVGSAGGLKTRWAPVASVVDGLLFEPREARDAQVRVAGRNRIFPVALGRAPGAATLHLTALPNMSSLLPPNAALLQRYRRKAEHTRIEGSQTVRLDTLDNLGAAAGVRVDVLKVDTQGTELDVLAGAERCLASDLLLAEIEVSFLQRYAGQPLAHEVIAFMAQRGFALLDLYRIKRYRFRNERGVGNVGLGGGQRAGQIAYADAVFVLEDVRLERRLAGSSEPDAARIALKLLFGLLVYGKADAAAALFDRVAGRFDPALRAGLAGWLGRLRGAEYGWRGLQLALDYLARKI